MSEEEKRRDDIDEEEEEDLGHIRLSDEESGEEGEGGLTPPTLGSEEGEESKLREIEEEIRKRAKAAREKMETSSEETAEEGEEEEEKREPVMATSERLKELADAIDIRAISRFVMMVYPTKRPVVDNLITSLATHLDVVLTLGMCATIGCIMFYGVDEGLQRMPYWLSDKETMKRDLLAALGTVFKIASLFKSRKDLLERLLRNELVYQLTPVFIGMIRAIVDDINESLSSINQKYEDIIRKLANTVSVLTVKLRVALSIMTKDQRAMYARIVTGMGYDASEVSEVPETLGIMYEPQRLLSTLTATVHAGAELMKQLQELSRQATTSGSARPNVLLRRGES